jgi:hypothetical protein
MPLRADDDMIVHADPQFSAGIGNVSGEGDIRPAGLRVARRMIVDEDDGCAPQINRTANDFADMDHGLINRSFGHHFVSDQHVFGIKMKNAHPLNGEMRHIDPQIIQQGLPAGKDWLLNHLAPQHAKGGGLHDLKRGCGTVADPAAAHDCLGVRRQQPANAAKFVDQFLGEGLRILARDGEGEEIFNQLMIKQSVSAALDQALSQARAVAGTICGFPIHVRQAIRWSVPAQFGLIERAKASCVPL